MKRIRILIADSNPASLTRTTSSLSRLPEVEIVGHTTSGSEALKLVESVAPDVFVFDEGIMKPTRVLLGDKSGVLCEAALRLRRMLPDLSTGACTVRSAETKEPLTEWHPDLVLLDPSRDECGGATPNPQAKARSGASRVLVLDFRQCKPIGTP